MAASTYRFENDFIMGWALDSRDEIKKIMEDSGQGVDLDEKVRDFEYTFRNEIEPVIKEGGVKMNLGGAHEKEKIIKTDKPSGIFDFGLAAQGLYRLQEFYSEELATRFPDKFKQYNLPSGIVPSDLVDSRITDGKTEYIYRDADGLFLLQKQQKGEQGIKDGIIGSRLEYATKTKKTYLTFKRNKGKVKYLEIYSLFYFAKVNGNLEFAIRHFPALMLANYFESIGIKTRVYMTRFVRFTDFSYQLKKENKGVALPMYYEALNNLSKTTGDNKLFVQPILAKDFGEELDLNFAFAMSQDDYSTGSIYESICIGAQRQEAQGRKFNIIGDPRWGKEDYFVGFERFRNKYEEYVKQGVFKSKEVLPEAMIFFHDIVINDQINDFIEAIRSNDDLQLIGKTKTAALLVPIVNDFFFWWMRLSANIIKVRVNLVNSLDLNKDLLEMRNDMYNLLYEWDVIDANIPSGMPLLKTALKEWAKKFLYEYNMTSFAGNPSFKSFITSIQNEITIYADGNLYETPDDRKDKLDALSLRILEALKNFDN